LGVVCRRELLHSFHSPFAARLKIFQKGPNWASVYSAGSGKKFTACFFGLFCERRKVAQENEASSAVSGSQCVTLRHVPIISLWQSDWE
jgi:hypothetical protein